MQNADQAPKGKDWNFELKNFYTVALLNFDINDDAFSNEHLRHEVKLMDTDTHVVFYDKLTFIYIEISKFNKTEDQLLNMYDKWLYVLKNMPHLQNQPKALQDRIFSKLFMEAEIARFTPEEYKEYEGSVKAYRDIKNSIDTAAERGKAEGAKAMQIEIAKKLLQSGMSIDRVSGITGLSAQERGNIF